MYASRQGRSSPSATRSSKICRGRRSASATRSSCGSIGTTSPASTHGPAQPATPSHATGGLERGRPRAHRSAAEDLLTALTDVESVAFLDESQAKALALRQPESEIVVRLSKGPTWKIALYPLRAELAATVSGRPGAFTVSREAMARLKAAIEKAAAAPPAARTPAVTPGAGTGSLSLSPRRERVGEGSRSSVTVSRWSAEVILGDAPSSSSLLPPFSWTSSTSPLSSPSRTCGHREQLRDPARVFAVARRRPRSGFS